MCDFLGQKRLGEPWGRRGCIVLWRTMIRLSDDLSLRQLSVVSPLFIACSSFPCHSSSLPVSTTLHFLLHKHDPAVNHKKNILLVLLSHPLAGSRIVARPNTRHL